MSAALVLIRAAATWAVAGTPADAGVIANQTITAEIRSAFAQHRDLQAPNQIYVDTRGDHVVYLSGQVYSSLSGDDAIDIARSVPGVTRVVSKISVEE